LELEEDVPLERGDEVDDLLLEPFLVCRGERDLLGRRRLQGEDQGQEGGDRKDRSF